MRNIVIDGLSSFAYSISKLFNEAVPEGERSAQKNTQNNTSIVVVVPDRKIAETLISNLSFFLKQNEYDNTQVCAFLDWEVLPFDTLSPTIDNSVSRLSTLYRIINSERLLIVTTPSALMQKIISPAQLKSIIRTVRAEEECDRHGLLALLDKGGYHRTTLVEEQGDLAVRGSVIDFFPPSSSNPIRIEFFDDVIESIRVFDAESQRSLNKLESFDVIPVAELPYITDVNLALARLKNRAGVLEIPLSKLAGIEEALTSSNFWQPGLEHLQGLLNPEAVTFADYLGEAHDKLQVCIYEELNSFSTASAFERLVRERSEKAFNEGRIFPEITDAYISAEEVKRQLREKVLYRFNTLQVLDDNNASSSEVGHLATQSASESLSPHGDVVKCEVQEQAVLKSELSISRQTNKPFMPVLDAVDMWSKQGYRVAFVTSQKQRNRKISDMLAGYGIIADELSVSFPYWLKVYVQDRITTGRVNPGQSNQVYILNGVISSGIIDPAERIVLVYENDIFPELVPRRKITNKKSIRKFLGTLSQLKEGDFIVHNDYGVACYHGLIQVLVNGSIGDFLHLEYAGGAKLYLPVENIGKVQKYVGVEGRKPVLSKLGTNAWAKTKQKVRAQVIELAGQLISLYAQREIVQGISYGAVTQQDEDFADSFGFEETPDQAKAIEDVLHDMAEAKPMDRLVCGDVGFGKTEVGMRAAFRAVNSGAQVAVLVPTTVLAEQHYKNFKERMDDFGVTVGAVSRFFSPQENKETLKQLSQGKIDVIIGTHRLIQKDVIFKNLGLLIIDEEHRFGVAHKEKLKQFRKEVDVLTLTATPIPRTLNMSLMGIRDLSIIETPPADRQVIQTYIAQYEDSTVREAILRELSRGGQVFYIHNRVQTIAGVAQEVEALVPEARVEFAHGQMKEGELSKIMRRFLNKEIDVLVSTTIVESGLDIANANTIIIRKAENFGLAELYQLRGRVGRSSRRAFAYLFISNMHGLGSEAQQRLKVLQSLDDLGVGFRLALQDMEIRGAGNLLGQDQSGEVNAVGFDLYSKILKDAVQEIRKKGTVQAEESSELVIDPEMKIGFPVHIPTDYIPDVSDRLLLYQRLVELEDKRAGHDILEEIEDRFGTVPSEVESLIEIMVFRSLLKKAGIVSVAYKNNKLSFSFHPQANFDRQKLVQQALASSSKSGVGKISISPAMVISVVLSEDDVSSPIDLYNQLLRILPGLGVVV